MELYKIVKLPNDNFSMSFQDMNTRYLATVQRLDLFIAKLKSIRDTVADLDVKAIAGDTTYDEDRTLERLENILFNAKLEEDDGRFILTGLANSNIQEYFDLKDCLHPKKVLELKRFGETSKYVVSRDGEHHRLSQRKYRLRFAEFASHINEVMYQMMEEDFIMHTEADVITSRLAQYAQSFYSINCSFPDAYITFFNMEGKPLFCHNSTYPDFTDRGAWMLESADICMDAERRFSDSLRQSLS
ncbi:hypothetical protein H6503_02685 [Candidatus Woesearchaeota archaeon]|nr:hypothetical protein [Candidatus Woesearchaeota archaeon]